MNGTGVLVLSDDLIFTSRITATAKAEGIAARWARDARRLLELATEQAAAAVIVDLANPGLEIDQLLAALPHKPRVIAYGSHVDTATLAAARTAGCDIVLPRSAFVERLESELRVWCAPR